MTVALQGVSGQQHAPAALYPQERPGTHCTGGWVGPRASLDRRKISLHRVSIPGPAPSQSLYRPSYPAHVNGNIKCLKAKINLQEVVSTNI